MNEFYRAKFAELFSEFNRYLIQHPEFSGRIPDGAEVILLDKSDPQYNRFVLAEATAASPENLIVYIDVGDLAPVRSRLRNPKMVSNTAAYTLRQVS